MKIRLTNGQAQDLAELLVIRNFSLPAALKYLNLAELDDASHQTLETLVFCCVGCDTWRRIEDLSDGNVCSRCNNWPDREEVELMYG